MLFLTVLRAGFWRGEVIVEEMFEEEKTCLKGEENSEWGPKTERLGYAGGYPQKWIFHFWLVRIMYRLSSFAAIFIRLMSHNYLVSQYLY